MKQEEKDLLLKDLCARLLYHPIVHINDPDVIDYDNYLYPDYLEKMMSYSIKLKPYLRPMTSMTEEEKRELEHISEEYFGKALDKQFQESLSLNINEGEVIEYIASSVIVDWLNKNHFDYRGLIEKGLAIDATGLNIY